MEIGALQLRQRPRRARKLRIGTLSYQTIGAPQAGQEERGVMIDSRRGSRWMQTLRNEPTQAPAPMTRVQRID